jgi:hypothetical protein
MSSGDSAYKATRETLLHQGVYACTATTHGSRAVIEDYWFETTTEAASLREAMDDATQSNEARLTALQLWMDMFVATQAAGGTDEALIVYGLDPNDLKNDVQAHASRTGVPCTIFRLHARRRPTGFNPAPREFVDTVHP